MEHLWAHTLIHGTVSMLVKMFDEGSLADLTLLASSKHLCQLDGHSLGEIAHGAIGTAGSTVVEVDTHLCISLTLAYKLATAVLGQPITLCLHGKQTLLTTPTSLKMHHNVHMH